MDLRLAPSRRGERRPPVRAVPTVFAALLCTASFALADPRPAHAGDAPSSSAAGSTAPRPVPPGVLPEKPDDYVLDAEQALAIAAEDPKVAEQTARHGRLETAIQVKEGGSWQVGYKSGENEVVQVIVDGSSGAIEESWTGYQVAWPMARGYEGQFGHKLNAPWVWIPLAAVFLVGLVDWRRKWRIVHLDLVVLLGFGISQIYFNRGEIGVSVPLVYPLLVYLLARMLWLGFRGGDGLRPTMPRLWLGIFAVFLIVFRITLNVADSGVIDVGYAGTVGADRITHGETLYGVGEFPEDNRFGDTYGPANYLAYVPFELALPWSGEWDALAASHAAAIAFDLLTVLGLFVFGLRSLAGRRGRELGVLLGFAWLAYPYTAYALQSNANDALVAAPIVWALALFAKPLARGALLAFASAVKFAPLILAPLFASGERGLLAAEPGTPGRWRTLRSPALFSFAFAAVLALLLVYPAIEPGLGTFYERTIESQLDRTSPFSIWGQVDGVEWLQKIFLVLAALLALLLSFVPRRRSIAQIAALAAAVMIALQLSVDHWFYLYIPWFAGPLLIALACATRGGREAPDSA